jgi:predicted nuclease of predicted toxin-antitoxin system
MDAAVVRYLRGRGHRVILAQAVGLASEDDDPVIQYALANDLVAITFDADFRQNVLRAGCRCVWIRYPESTARQRVKNGYVAVIALLDARQPLVRIQPSGIVQADPGRSPSGRRQRQKRERRRDDCADMARPVGSVNFSSDEVRKLRELATAGISMVEAARRLHRHPSTVLRQARKLGLLWRRPAAAQKTPKPPTGPPGRRWTEADDARLRQLVTAGASIDRAAKDLDRQVSLVWRRADTLGLRWSRSRRPAN